MKSKFKNEDFLSLGIRFLKLSPHRSIARILLRCLGFSGSFNGLVTYQGQLLEANAMLMPMRFYGS